MFAEKDFLLYKLRLCDSSLQSGESFMSENLSVNDNEIKLDEIISDEDTQALMHSDKVSSDDLIQIIMSVKDKAVKKSA